MARFVCGRCGDCCRFAGRSNGYVSRMRERIQNCRGPIYYMQDAESIGPPLFSWEAGGMSKFDSRFSYEPATFVYDIKAGKALVTGYSMSLGVCVFLGGGNACRIYDIRPLVCRSFPLVKSGISENKIEFWRYDCPRAFDVKLPELMTDGEYAEVMEDAYGENFLWAVGRDAAGSWLNQTVMRAEDEGLINLLKDIPHSRALELARTSKPKDFFDHMIEVNPQFAQEYSDMTRNLYDLEYVRGILENVI
jgi:Fe-S-cluster containining protein